MSGKLRGFPDSFFPGVFWAAVDWSLNNLNPKENRKIRMDFGLSKVDKIACWGHGCDFVLGHHLWSPWCRSQVHGGGSGIDLSSMDRVGSKSTRECCWSLPQMWQRLRFPFFLFCVTQGLPYKKWVVQIELSSKIEFFKLSCFLLFFVLHRILVWFCFRHKTHLLSQRPILCCCGGPVASLERSAASTGAAVPLFCFFFLGLTDVFKTYAKLGFSDS